MKEAFGKELEMTSTPPPTPGKGMGPPHERKPPPIKKDEKMIRKLNNLTYSIILRNF
jgi:hypothetical protein